MKRQLKAVAELTLPYSPFSLLLPPVSLLLFTYCKRLITDYVEEVVLCKSFTFLWKSLRSMIRQGKKKSNSYFLNKVVKELAKGSYYKPKKKRIKKHTEKPCYHLSYKYIYKYKKNKKILLQSTAFHGKTATKRIRKKLTIFLQYRTEKKL